MDDQLHPSLQSLRFRRHTQHFLALAWQALVRDLWTMSYGVLCFTQLCTLFDVCSQALDCASALDRVCRFQPLCLLMAARQTSIIITTAPPAPALAANVETEPAVFTSDVVLPTRVESTHQESHCCSHWSLASVPQRLHLARCSRG